MPEPGDWIELIADRIYRGILMPGDAKYTVLKLPSGYNIAIAKAKIKGIKLIKKAVPAEVRRPELPARPGLPTISILHTGGTIASAVDYATGGVVARFSPEDLLQLFPELHEIANIRSRLITNIFSENMRFSNYNSLAKEIAKEIRAGSQGIVIGHGTDTLHYTAAALSFAVQDLPVPVILVGSQRSSDRGSSDAAVNLLSAGLFAAQADWSGVGVCMHAGISDDLAAILPGTRCRKMHSCARAAFKAIGTRPIALVDWERRQIDFLAKSWQKRRQTQPRLALFNEKLKVGLIKCHTNMWPEQFEAYRGWDGLVIEGFGLGHAPISASEENIKIYRAIAQLAKSMPVVMTSQTIAGPINMHVYSTGRKLLKLGIGGNYCDLTPETALIKLAWLLSNFPKGQVLKLFSKNFVGELTERQEWQSESF